MHNEHDMDRKPSGVLDRILVKLDKARVGIAIILLALAFVHTRAWQYPQIIAFPWYETAPYIALTVFEFVMGIMLLFRYHTRQVFIVLLTVVSVGLLWGLILTVQNQWYVVPFMILDAML